MKKRLLAMASAAAMCLSAVPVSSSATPEPSVPLWIPNSFEEALEFDMTYGKTHIEDGVICLVFREATYTDHSYDIVLKAGEADERFRETFEYDDVQAQYKYEVVAYRPTKAGEFEVALNSVFSDSTREDSSYQFYVDEYGRVTETDIYAWLPDSLTEYRSFEKLYGKASVHDNYIVYCAEVNYSTGATLIMKQNGTAEIKEFMRSSCSRPYVITLAGTTSNYIQLYQPVSDGTVDVSWTVGREWELEESTVSHVESTFEISGNGTSVKQTEPDPNPIPDDHTQRISVVDYDTGKLLRFPYTAVKTIGFRTGYEVEYALTDGGFAWGTAWSPVTKWDYFADNPFVINAVGGAHGDDYEVTEIKLPDGYFLPDDHLEVTEYDNDSADIRIKLKKTLTGDVNGDGVFSVADVALLGKWLLGRPETKLADWKAADLCKDDKLDVFDLTLMKRTLLEGAVIETEIPDVLFGYEKEEEHEYPTLTTTQKLALKCKAFCPVGETLKVDAAMGDLSLHDDEWDYDYEISSSDFFINKNLIVNGEQGEYKKIFPKEEWENLDISGKEGEFDLYHHETSEIDFSGYKIGDSGCIEFFFVARHIGGSHTGMIQRVYFYVGEKGTAISNLSADDAKENYQST